MIVNTTVWRLKVHGDDVKETTREIANAVQNTLAVTGIAYATVVKDNTIHVLLQEKLNGAKIENVVKAINIWIELLCQMSRSHVVFSTTEANNGNTQAKNN